LEDVKGLNSAAVAFSDLWFYSNPVYVERLQTVSTKLATAKPWDALIEPSGRSLLISFKKPYTGLLEVFDSAGKRVIFRKVTNESSFQTSVMNFPVGVYSILIDGCSQKVCIK